MGNVPLGRIVQVESVASKLRYEDGHELAFPVLDKSYWPAFSGAREVAAICRELGLAIPPLQAEVDDSRRLKLFVIPSEQARSLFDKPATLYSTLKMYEIAFHEEVRMPARPGASSSSDGQRWDLRQIRLAEGRVDVSLRQLVATTMFVESGGESAGRLTDGYKRGFVLLNRKLGEFSLTGDAWGSAYHPPGVLAAAERYLRFWAIWRQGGSQAVSGIDEAWLNDAELIILSSREVGTFEKKIELDNFYVPEPPDTFRPQDKPFWQ
jgi:hypothetical protein